MIPGMDLLDAAFSLIAPQQITHLQFTGRIKAADGQFMSIYAPPNDDVYGSVQAVPRKMYDQLGLDRNKNYVNVFTDIVFIADVERNGSGDKVVYNGLNYLCESITDWAGQDGWIQALCVEIPAVRAPLQVQPDTQVDGE